ncbi:MAG: pyridoxamine 5'-phosphate oxidase family protein [Planctomycetota bacterium]|jgi:nitroimidazol reductase NimA-like FMN-containing flavoprotein (pyridoxamine 5'-phosphate oxidase superfamily)
MRRSEKEITSRGEIDDVLARAEVLRVAMCDGERPYVVPVCFGYDGSALWFHSAREGRKLDVIARNPSVAFEAATGVEVVIGGPGCRSTAKYLSVIGSGTATLVQDENERRRGLDAIMRHYGGEAGGYATEALAKTAVVRIDIDEMTGKRSGR